MLCLDHRWEKVTLVQLRLLFINYFFPIVTPEDTESDNTVTPEYASGNGVTGFCLEQGSIFSFFFFNSDHQAFILILCAQQMLKAHYKIACQQEFIMWLSANRLFATRMKERWNL